MNFNLTSAFQKDYKRLCKKYYSLELDFDNFKKILVVFPLGKNKHFAVLHISSKVRVAKARFFCRTLKGSSLRVVYGYRESIAHIDFIEIYYKGEQAIENRQRINEYLKNL